MIYNLNKYDISDIKKRGFSIIKKDGKIINSTSQIKSNDKIILDFNDGFADSTINSIYEKE